MLLNKKILDAENYKNYNKEAEFIKNLKLLFLIKKDNIKDIPRIVFKDYIFLYTNYVKNDDFFTIDHSSKFVKFHDIYDKEETMINIVFLLTNIFVNKQLNSNYKTFLNKLSNEYIFFLDVNEKILINIFKEKIKIKDFNLLKIDKKDFNEKEFLKIISSVKNLDLNFEELFKNNKNDYLFLLFLNVIEINENNIKIIFNNLNILDKNNIPFINEILLKLNEIDSNKTYDYILYNINILNKLNNNDNIEKLLIDLYRYNIKEEKISEKDLFKTILELLKNNENIKNIKKIHSNIIENKILNQSKDLDEISDI